MYINESTHTHTHTYSSMHVHNRHVYTQPRRTYTRSFSCLDRTQSFSHGHWRLHCRGFASHPISNPTPQHNGRAASGLPAAAARQSKCDPARDGRFGDSNMAVSQAFIHCRSREEWENTQVQKNTFCPKNSS